MYSKEEAARLKKEFWTAFGKAFPRKWRLYNTGIKDLSLKFYANNKKAEVSVEIEMKDLELRESFYNKWLSLENLIKEDYVPDALFSESYYLSNGKEISRIWVTLENVSIFNKNTWRDIFEFFVAKMSAFENCFNDFEDFIKDV